MSPAQPIRWSVRCPIFHPRGITTARGHTMPTMTAHRRRSAIDLLSSRRNGAAPLPLAARQAVAGDRHFRGRQALKEIVT
jgi:hypothetical protein